MMNALPTPPATANLLTVNEVANLLSVSVRTVWRYVETQPGFPKPIHLSPRATRFSLDGLRRWQSDLEEQGAQMRSLEELRALPLEKLQELYA